MTTGDLLQRPSPTGELPVVCALGLEVTEIAAFLNAELVDHPVYDGFELQRFDDPQHGRGMLVFLSRRGSRLVDYYVEPGLKIDRASYELGGGTGRWVETHLDPARLEVTDGGVDAAVRFTDVDGRSIEVRVDDRLAGRRRPAVLLAPVGAAIDRPASLLLVHIRSFGLVRRVSPDPVIEIAGERVSTGRLPGQRLHRRHLIKYGAPLTTAQVCPAGDGPLRPIDPAAPGDVTLTPDRAVATIAARDGSAHARLVLDPPMPALEAFVGTDAAEGRWSVEVDDLPITGGTWRIEGRGAGDVEVHLEVTEPWQPPSGQPPLLRIVTRVLPTFRRWPTTYRWTADVALRGRMMEGVPWMRSSWQRTEAGLADRYRRVTGG